MSPSKHAVDHFIAEPVDVRFNVPPAFIKKPPCPDGFSWQGQSFTITACLAAWVDFSRRGRMAKNMQPQHIQAAKQRGSWGVGRYYFDVQTQNMRCFRLYYDRAPADATDRTGTWVLLAELTTIED
ncbi:MAG: DUF6504 family protein [Brevefilum sp.]